MNVPGGTTILVTHKNLAVAHRATRLSPNYGNMYIETRCGYWNRSGEWEFADGTKPVCKRCAELRRHDETAKA